jgi:hypothetical protein
VALEDCDLAYGLLLKALDSQVFYKAGNRRIKMAAIRTAKVACFQNGETYVMQSEIGWIVAATSTHQQGPGSPVAFRLGRASGVGPPLTKLQASGWPSTWFKEINNRKLHL